MLFKLYLPFTTLVVSFCGLSHASKAIKNDVQDLRVATFVNAIREDGHWPVNQSENGIQEDISPNSKCRMDLEYIINELENVSKGQTISDWTLDFLDSIGKVPSDIGQGNILWLGDYILCQSVNAKERDFKGQYCLSIWHQPSNPTHLMSVIGQTGLRLGLCFPDSCANKDDLKASLVLYKKIIRFLPGSRALNEVTRNFKSIECKKPPQWTLSGHSCIIFMLLLVVVTFLATIKDRNSRKDWLQNERKNADNKKKASVWVTCFSLDTSLKAFRWTESRSENMNCLNGLRFLGTVWVVSVHSFEFQVLVSGNKLAIPDILEMHWFTHSEIIGLGPDIFFLLSGLLISYQFFRGVQSGQKFNLIHFCLKRYLRLIPPVVFSAWFYATVFPHLGSGPFWDDGNGHYSEVVNCQNNWWRNALGIHNFDPFSIQCLGFTWQSAADLQMSILSPIYLFALNRSTRLGMVLIAVSTLASVLATGVSTWKAGTKGFPSLVNYYQTTYATTWCRCGPYFIGMILGYFLATNKATIASISKSTAKKITWISVLLCVSMIFIPFLSLEEPSTVIFHSVQKVIWSIGLSGLLIVSLSGHEQALNRLLSWKPFVQLSQLSYSVSIVHIFVYCYFLKQISSPLTFTPMSTLIMFIGLQPAVFTIALLFFVLVESPINQLGKILFSASFEKKIK